MKTANLIASIIFSCSAISLNAQDTIKEGQSSYLPLTTNPKKSTITLISTSDSLTGALYLLKDSSILVSSSLLKEDYYSGNYEVAELFIDDIKLISPKRRVGQLGGVFLGALVGVGVGALTARIVEGPKPEPVPSELWWGRPYYPDYSPNYLPFITAGALLGATTGFIMGMRIEIPINGSMENYNLQKKKLGRYTVKYLGSPKY